MTSNPQKPADKQNSSTKPIVLLTGGGTGGHIYPNLALLPDLKTAGFTTVYMGAGNSMEKRLAELNGIPFYTVDSVKLSREKSLKALKNNLTIVPKLFKSRAKAIAIMKNIKPDVVFSKGGFVSLPAVLAAKKLNIPCVCHESDYTLGLANKLAALTGAEVLKANPHSRFKSDFAGMPVRKELFEVSRAQARAALGLNAAPSSQPKTVLIVGGSSGAAALNLAAVENLEKLCEKYFVIHITGKNKGADLSDNFDESIIDNIRKNYMPLEYSDDIKTLFAAADLVVSRAGATAVFELASLKKRALFIPLPKGASRGDQLYNAELAKEFGASVLKQNKNLKYDLFPAVENALKTPPMKPIISDANGKIVQILYASIRRGEICSDKKQSPNGWV